MRLSSLGFFLGIIFLNTWQHLPNIHIASIILLLGIFTFIIVRKNFSRFIPAFAIGLGWAMLFANIILQHQLSQNLENKTVLIQGKIISIPEMQNNELRFDFMVNNLTWNNQIYPSPNKIRLYWHGKIPQLQIGDTWQLNAKLKRPHGAFNPGGFDEETFLFSQRIRAVGTVIDSQNNYRLSKNNFLFINHFRELLAQKIVNTLNGNPMTGFITALIIGIRTNITEQQWQVLRNTGTNHLMAIAGLHIGFVAAIIYWLINQLWRAHTKLLLILPAPQVAATVALFAATSYAALAGFSLPTQRALIMLSIFLLSQFSKRFLPAWQALLLALIIILIFDPLAPLSASFWLSFVAVAIISYATYGRLQSILKWRKLLYLQWILTLGLLPLTLIFFQQISLLGIVANIIAIPWIGFLVMPLCISSIVFFMLEPRFSAVLIKFSAITMQGLWWILEKLADINFLQWHTALNNNLLLICISIAIILLLAPRGIPARWLSIIWFSPLFLWHPTAPQFAQIKINILDVGQGLAAVIQTSKHVLLYDTGAKFGDFNYADTVIIPFLRLQGIKKIDVLVISHSDNDHSGGAQALLKTFPVKQIITSVPAMFPFSFTKPCVRGQQWQWDGINFNFLFPPVDQTYLDNDSSCVLRISLGKNNILFPGDIEKTSEDYLLQQEINLLPANVLIAPHHGSKTSSTLAFVQAVYPSMVIFPVGYLNHYHFPNAEIITRYQDLGAQCYRTDLAGAILLNVSPTNISLIKYREQYKHYWNL